MGTPAPGLPGEPTPGEPVPSAPVPGAPDRRRRRLGYAAVLLVLAAALWVIGPQTEEDDAGGPLGWFLSPSTGQLALMLVGLAALAAVKALTRPRHDVYDHSVDRTVDQHVEMGRDLGALLSRRPLLRTALIVTLLLATVSVLTRW